MRTDRRPSAHKIARRDVDATTARRMLVMTRMRAPHVAAAFAFLTANRDDLLPRKPPATGGRGGQ